VGAPAQAGDAHLDRTRTHAIARLKALAFVLVALTVCATLLTTATT